MFSTQPLMTCVGVVPCSCLWCLAGEWQLLSKSFLLLGFPFPGPLAKESRLLLGHFCLHQVTSFFSSKSGLHKAKKKFQGTQHCVIFWSSRSLASVCLSTFQSHLLFVFLMSGFLVILNRRNRKSTSTSSSQKMLSERNKLENIIYATVHFSNEKKT